jgi:hypothetical protein
VGRRVRGVVVLVLVAALCTPLGAGGVVVALRTADGDPVPLAGQGATAITVGTLYAITVMVPITDAVLLSCDVTIQGGAWDNDQLLPLQPMNKLAWVFVRQDGELVTPEDSLDTPTAGTCRFEASGIFRATESGSYRIEVSYNDETLGEPLALVYGFEAAVPSPTAGPSKTPS